MLSIIVFFLQYVNLYFPIKEIASSVLPEIYKVETLDINRYNVLGGAFILICPSLFIFNYLEKQDKISLAVAILVVIIYLLSTYRTSFLLYFFIYTNYIFLQKNS